MKRTYTEGIKESITFFVGIEIERTPAYGMKTLFVVGTPSLDGIFDKANDNDCTHIYFGTSQSFNPTAISHEEYRAWDNVIIPCLKKNYWVTLDFDSSHNEGVLESGYSEYPRFVPMISVKLPYINQHNYNATLKLDDRTWGATNPGVWTHHLQSLMSKDKYTHWDQYTQDTIL